VPATLDDQHLQDGEMIELNPRLMSSHLGLIDSPMELNACLNAHGLYNSVQYVLRLSPEVHRRIAGLPQGIIRTDVDFDKVQAYSTYLHETIHWWQHIGSTTGLMLSLSYPAQAHANYSQLRSLLQAIGPKKSILKWITTTPTAGGGPDTPRGLANIVVNTHFDIEFFRILATNPGIVQQVVEHSLFDSIGRSYAIAYANILSTLATTLNDPFAVITDPRGWETEFTALRDRRKTGYYYGSEVRVSPIGAHQIFEGQARFTQLQFLYFASRMGLGWDEIRAKGMLEGVYGEAFRAFLELANLEWPSSIDHPTVALFMLVCDMAINPSAGFPMPLQAFPTFITDTDPGMRFLFLCRVIATMRPDVVTRITRYSREEYLEVSEALAAALLIDPPVGVAHRVAGWTEESEAIRQLMAEYRTFAYLPENLAVRLLFSHFLAFCADKRTRPEFFCWPGAWMAGERVSDEGSLLLDRHSAPFMDKADDSGIYPRVMPGRNAGLVQTAFNGFYAMNVTYEMTRQWIGKAGPFEYDYGWLSSSGTAVEMKMFGDRHFEMLYGVHPDAFEII